MRKAAARDRRGFHRELGSGRAAAGGAGAVWPGGGGRPAARPRFEVGDAAAKLVVLVAGPGGHVAHRIEFPRAGRGSCPRGHRSTWARTGGLRLAPHALGDTRGVRSSAWRIRPSSGWRVWVMAPLSGASRAPSQKRRTGRPFVAVHNAQTLDIWLRAGHARRAPEAGGAALP